MTRHFGFGLRTALAAHKALTGADAQLERFERLEPFELVKFLSAPQPMRLFQRKPKTVIGILIRAQVEPDQRRELMQMCKSWLSNQLPAACLERRVYEDVISPTHLLLVEQWLDAAAMNSYLSSERFRALIGAVKVLGELVDVRISETNVIEAG